MGRKAEQLGFDIQKVCRTETVDIGLINIPEGVEESFYSSLFRSVSYFRDVFQDVLLKERGDGRYDIVFGLRRTLAAQKAGLKEMEARIFPPGTPKEVFASLVLAENMNRRPNPAAEADALRTVISAYGWSAPDVSRNLGIPAAHVANRMRLLRLIPELFERLRRGDIALSAAQNLSKLPEERQKEFVTARKITLSSVEAAVRDEHYEGLIADELFEMPANKTTEFDRLVEQAVSSVQHAIEASTNGNKGQLEKALVILKGVLECRKA